MPKKAHISKDLYETIMNGITSGVWASDREDVIHYANRAMEMIAGVTHQRLIGSSVFGDFAENATLYFRLNYLEAKESLKPVHYADIPV
ncbi:MAG: PAS domain-containing protein, partial [Thermodesulfovibrionales bacterium]